MSMLGWDINRHMAAKTPEKEGKGEGGGTIKEGPHQ